MQRIIHFSPLAFFLLLTACTVPSNPIDLSISETNIEHIGLSTTLSSIHITVTNNSSQEAEIHWNRIENTSIAGSTYKLNGSTSNTGILNIPANSSVDATLCIIPKGNLGMSSGDIEFYDPAHQETTTKTFHYSFTSVNQYFRLNLATPANETNYISSSNAMDSHTHHVWLINDNTSPVKIQWARTSEHTNPTNWLISPKTHEICYPPSVMTSSAIIPPMDSIPLKLTFHHRNTTGYGRTTPIFWVDTDSLNSVKMQPFTYEVLP